jgi:hypothetical protein
MGMGSFIKAIRPLIEKVSTASAPVVTEAPVAKATPIDYKKVNLKNVYDQNPVLRKMFGNADDYISLFAKGGPVDYLYNNRETIYVPEDEKIIDEEEDIMASAPNPRAEKNSIAIELFGKPLFQLTPMEMEQLENFLQEKATKLAMGGIVSLAGGGSAGYPPIEVGIINTPDQNLNVGLSQNLDPFASYTRNFEIPGGQAGAGIYAQRGMAPSIGAGFGMMDQGNQFSGNINYNQDRGPQLGLQYRREFEPGGGLNSLFRMK